MQGKTQGAVSMKTYKLASEELEREVISCKVCGLVQYRTRTGNCRSCLRLLSLDDPGYAIRSSGLGDLRCVQRQDNRELLNLEMVENIGQRIQQIRKLRGLTQNELYKLSRVSRSYLARIESGLMTPSIGTLEKISEALGVSLKNFFIPNDEALLEDPFIQGLHPFLRQLDLEQWQSILTRLATISDRVAFGHAKLCPLAMPQSAPIDDRTCRPIHPAAMGNRSAG